MLALFGTFMVFHKAAHEVPPAPDGSCLKVKLVYTAVHSLNQWFLDSQKFHAIVYGWMPLTKRLLRIFGD